MRITIDRFEKGEEGFAKRTFAVVHDKTYSTLYGTAELEKLHELTGKELEKMKRKPKKKITFHERVPGKKTKPKAPKKKSKKKSRR